MIDPVVLGYATLAMLGLLGFQLLFIIWLFYADWKWKNRERVEVKPK